MKRIGVSEFFARVAAEVFAPDRYAGEWYVVLGRGRRRCTNYTTARAWANYLRRRGYWQVAIEKVS